MKVLIVYGTKYGCTEKCAKLLSEAMDGSVILHNLKESEPDNLDNYETIIIGGPVYMGQLQKQVDEFCKSNIDILKNKKLGIFTTCMRDGELADQQLKSSYPKELVDVAIVKDYFGGEFTFSKMSFIDKMIVKMVAKVNKDSSNVSREKIKEFAKELQ